MAWYIWKGPGRCFDALPGDRVELTKAQADYLRGEMGSECLATAKKPRKPRPAPEAPAPEES